MISINLYYLCLKKRHKVKKKKIFLRFLKVIGCTLCVAVVLFVITFFALNSSVVQNRLMRYSTQLLSEKLHTDVQIDSISIHLPNASVRLMGLRIDDPNHQELLRLKRLETKMSPLALLKRQMVVQKLNLEGVNAVVKSATDSTPANYQFLLDAFKQDATENGTEKKQDAKFVFAISQAQLKDVYVSYNRNKYSFKAIHYNEKKNGRHAVTIQRLHVLTDNGLPRKNTGKPHRGFYDKGHLNVWADASITIDTIGKDTIVATLENCQATDTVAGLYLSKIYAKVKANQQHATLENVEVVHLNTKLKTNAIEVTLPSKKEYRAFSLVSEEITGQTLPKDIARAFAPALKSFSILLNLRTHLVIADGIVKLNDIHIFTTDRQLSIRGEGLFRNLKKEQKKNVHLLFTVKELQTNANMATRIVNQFTVKKLMMNELSRLGQFRYYGSFSILWKRVVFTGKLCTNPGDINLNFTIDGLNKYLSGSANTHSFHLGKVLELPKLGDISCSTRFKVDISKPRTARIRKVKGGKLPIGTLSAQVQDCSYDNLHVRNINTDIVSNGAEATGNVWKNSFLGDLGSSFTYIDTDQEHKVKVHFSGVKKHQTTSKNEKLKEKSKKGKKVS